MCNIKQHSILKDSLEELYICDHIKLKLKFDSFRNAKFSREVLKD